MNALVMNCSPVRNGATAEIVNVVSDNLKEKYDVRNICIDDYDFNFCKGCRSCHNTAKCNQKDDIEKIIEQYEWADVIISVAPSYWADIPGQFKAFIDRCTMEIECCDSLGLCSIEYKEAVAARKGEIIDFCNKI